MQLLKQICSRAGLQQIAPAAEPFGRNNVAILKALALQELSQYRRSCKRCRSRQVSTSMSVVIKLGDLWNASLQNTLNKQAIANFTAQSTLWRAIDVTTR